MRPKRCGYCHHVLRRKPRVPKRLQPKPEEAQHIQAVLRSVGGKKKQAAALLGIHPTTLTRRLDRYARTCRKCGELAAHVCELDVP
jgi:transcriptional regulator with GAF, ATPase, and Fis domain